MNLREIITSVPELSLFCPGLLIFTFILNFFFFILLSFLMLGNSYFAVGIYESSNWCQFFLWLCKRVGWVCCVSQCGLECVDGQGSNLCLLHCRWILHPLSRLYLPKWLYFGGQYPHKKAWLSLDIHLLRKNHVNVLPGVKYWLLA